MFSTIISLIVVLVIVIISGSDYSRFAKKC